MSNTPTSGGPIPAGPNLRRVLLLDIALPALAVFLLERNGTSALAAYAVAGVFPIASIAAAWLRERSVDIIGIAVVLGIGSGLILGFVTADPRFALVRAAPGFALFGVAALASLATERPLMFFVARAFGAAGDAAQIAAWNQRLVYPRFQAVMRRLTLVWGVSALAEACLAVSAAFLLPGQIAVIAEPLLAFGTVGALLAWTRSVQRRAPPPSESNSEPSTLSASAENGHA